MSLQRPQDIPLQTHDTIPPSEQVFDVDDLYLTHPLPPGQASIRVLDLEYQPDSDSAEQLRGRLRVIPLSSSAHFAALSYVWGDRTPTHKLRCETIELPITTNLHAALIQLRQRRGMTIWVDAICINQSHEEEKREQIPLMGDVFSQARTVYVWLGPGNSRTDAAMTLLNDSILRRYWVRRPALCRSSTLLTLGMHFVPWLRDILSVLSVRDFRILVSSKISQGSHIHARQMLIQLEALSLSLIHRPPLYPEGLVDILNREWLLRAWTFQEFILARNPVILCGSKSASWDRFMRGLTMEHYGDWPYTQLKSFRKDAWMALFMQWYRLPRKKATPSLVPTRKLLRSRSPHGETRAHHSTRSSSMFKEDYDLFVRIVTSSHSIGPYTWAALRIYGILLPAFLDGVVRPANYKVIVCISVFPIVIVFCFTCIIFTNFKRHFTMAPMSTELGDEILDGILRALRSRVAEDSRDKCYALYGVMAVHGVPAQRVDYSKTKHEVFGAFLVDLTSWDASLSRLLLDSGLSAISGAPSWIPDWDRTVLHQCRHPWLPVRHIYEKSFHHRTKGDKQEAQGPRLDSGMRLVTTGIILDRVNSCRSFWPSGLETIGSDGRVNIDRRETATNAMMLALLLHWIQDYQLSPRLTVKNQSAAKAIFAVLEVGEDLNKGLKSENFEIWYARVIHYLQDLRPKGNLESNLPELQMRIDASPNASAYHFRLTELAIQQRSFIVTDNGYVGCSPPLTRQEDQVALIAGVPTPVILRKATMEGYIFVGPAYIEIMMEDDLWDERVVQDIMLV